MTESRKPLLILGAGAFAIDVADLVEDIGGWRVEGFVQNLKAGANSSHAGLPVYWIEDAARDWPEAWVICAVGSPRRRAFIEQAAACWARFATLVHPCARVSRQAELGEGVVVHPGAVISTNTRIGRHVVVNRGALVGHHVRVGDFAFLAPGVNVCGACEIGEDAFLGAASVVTDHRKIGPGVVVGAGAVVLRDIEAGARVFGVPARPRAPRAATE